MSFDLLRLRFLVRPDGAGSIRKLGAALPRFFDCFRAVVCSRESVAAEACIVCPDVAACTFSLICHQNLAVDPELVRRHQKPPLPFVLTFPLQRDDGGAILDLVLAGVAVASYQEFTRAVALLCERCGIELTGWRSLGYQGEELPEGEIAVLSGEQTGFEKVLSPDFVVLEFESPCRLFRHGRQCTSLEPAHFLMSLVRRVSALAAYYCGHELQLDYRTLADAASSCEVLESSLVMSPYVPHGLKRGLVGSCELAGPLRDFANFLAIGELLHVGKGASYGYGRFRIS